jgi:DNA-binding response OmpR family regulator
MELNRGPMDAKPVVLVAAREAVVRRLATAALRPAGMSVVESGLDASLLDRAADANPDVIIIEAAEPPVATFALIRDLRTELSVPILLMSPLATPTRVAPALDAGADDYLARPFDPSELSARVRALVRRRGDLLRTGTHDIAGSTVDFVARRVTRGGLATKLNRAEWSLLALLVANEGRVLFADELIAAAFGPERRGDLALLQTAIGRLRRKLGLPPWTEGPIRTVRGIGYAYDPADRMPRFRSRSARRAEGSAPSALGSR